MSYLTKEITLQTLLQSRTQDPHVRPLVRLSGSGSCTRTFACIGLRSARFSEHADSAQPAKKIARKLSCVDPLSDERTRGPVWARGQRSHFIYCHMVRYGFEHVRLATMPLASRSSFLPTPYCLVSQIYHHNQHSPIFIYMVYGMFCMKKK